MVLVAILPTIWSLKWEIRDNVYFQHVNQGQEEWAIRNVRQGKVVGNN